MKDVGQGAGELHVARTSYEMVSSLLHKASNDDCGDAGSGFEKHEDENEIRIQIAERT